MFIYRSAVSRFLDQNQKLESSNCKACILSVTSYSKAFKKCNRVCGLNLEEKRLYFTSKPLNKYLIKPKG